MPAALSTNVTPASAARFLQKKEAAAKEASLQEGSGGACAGAAVKSRYSATAA
jgi:hypothetical protein